MFGVITAAAAAATEVPLCSKLSVPEKLRDEGVVTVLPQASGSHCLMSESAD